MKLGEIIQVLTPPRSGLQCRISVIHQLVPASTKKTLCLSIYLFADISGPCSSIWLLSVKLNLRNKETNERTDGQRDKSLFPFVCLLRLLGASILWKGERSAMLHRNLRGRTKIRDQQINTRDLVSWLSGKELKYCNQMSHFKAKMHQIRFLASVRSFVS